MKLIQLRPTSLRSSEIISSSFKMHLSSFVQNLVAVTSLVGAANSAAIAPQARRGLFIDNAPNTNTSMAIVNEVDSNPTLQVSNLMIGSDGTWKRVRSLGGPLAAEWLSMHQNGSPNTTVAWSNGSIVMPNEVAAIVPLSKRWGWTDNNIELVIWPSQHFVVGDAGFNAGFMSATASAIYGAIYNWMHNGPPVGAYTFIGNNNTPDNHFEPNIYYSQSITTKLDDGQYPSVGDMNNAAHAAMQDMANNNYQGACYEGMIHYSYTGGTCLVTEFAHVQFCSWKWGGSCVTPTCEWSLGEGSGNCQFGGQQIA